MTIKEALAFGLIKLSPAFPHPDYRGRKLRIDGAALCASVLLCQAMGKTKEFIYTYPEKKLTAPQEKKYKNFIARRARREPLAYILGKKEFYGLEFLVSPAVLIPRPETEILITAVINSTIDHNNNYNIIDVGTGSGAIAITLKKLLPKTRVFASDVSSAALALAKKNARRLSAKIIFKKGGLLAPFFSCHSRRRSDSEGLIRESNIKKLDSRLRGNDKIVITANLPYLSRAEWQKCQPEVKKYEPYNALVGGKTGTEIYEKLFKQINSSRRIWEVGRDLLLNPPQSSFSEGGKIHLLIEIGYNQKRAITRLAKKIINPQKIEFIKDLSGRWRVAKITIKL